VTIGGANDKDDCAKGSVIRQQSLIDELGRYASWFNPQNVIIKSLSNDSKSTSRSICYKKDDRTLFEKVMNCTNIMKVVDSDDENILKRPNSTMESNDTISCDGRSTQYSFEDTYVSRSISADETKYSYSSHSKMSLSQRYGSKKDNMSQNHTSYP